MSNAHADVDPNSGIDFVTIGAVGNSPWPGTNPPTPGDRAVGRGSVSYEYRIGKFEVTTAQWVEFFNAAYDRPAGDVVPFLQTPSNWGGSPTAPVNAGNPIARRWTSSPASGQRPTGNISWRTAAIYCNWLHNGKASNREAFLSGAYDVSTFGFTPGGRFLDQLTRSPGARYWVPSWDEWIKAAHFDENKLNPDGTRGGWWQYSNGTDQPLVGGPPASMLPPGDPRAGTANFGWDASLFPGLGLSPFSVAIGAYGVTSPYGLFDVAGATGEWTEEAFYAVPGDPPTSRQYDGSHWLDGSSRSDYVSGLGGGTFPSYSGFDVGFRVAAAIPAPGLCSLVLGFGLMSTVRRRRSHETAMDSWRTP